MRFPITQSGIRMLSMLAFLWLVPTARAQVTVPPITLQPGFTSIIPNGTSATGFGSKNYTLNVPANVQTVFLQLEVTQASTDNITLSFSQGTPNFSGSFLGGVNCQQATYGNSAVVASQSFTFALSNTNTVLACPALPILNLTITLNSGTANFDLFAFSSVLPIQSAVAVNATSLTSQTSNGAAIVEKGGRWGVLSTPSVSVQATTSRAAGATGVRHVADCISYSAGAIAAPAATQLTLNLRDGASGAGTIIWSKTLTIPATAAPHYDGNFCGLNLIGSPATAMTLEFSALLTNEFESVTLTGYDVQ